MNQSGMPGLREIEQSELRRISAQVLEFEALWRQSHGPDLHPFLPEDGEPVRLRVLIELVRVDQEHRWEKGDRRPLEAYLADWPELRERTDVLEELVSAECLTRFCLQAPPTTAEIAARFPEVVERIDLETLRAQAASERREMDTERAEDQATVQMRRPLLSASSSDSVETAPESDASRDASSTPSLLKTGPRPKRRPVRLGQLSGQRFGRYELRHMIAAGGMGVVYEARDNQLGRIVALKIPKLELIEDPVALQRFLIEARTAAAIRHPNVCPIFELGEIDGQHFLTMPLIDGVSLAGWIEQQSISSRDAANITRKLASALSAVHGANILHRDIKASNVMIDERGEPLLMDFGLAHVAGPDARLTQTGSLVGTPAYMAPEQVEGGATAGDARSDIYSLGTLLYQMLTGRLPFEGPVTRVLVDIATKEPTRIDQLRSEVDPDLAALCHKAMSRHPDNRFQTADEFESALQDWLNSSPVETADEPPTLATSLCDTETTTFAAVPRDNSVAKQTGRQGGRGRRLVIGLSAAALLLLASVITIQLSDRAELIIRSEQPGVAVSVRQLNEPEHDFTLTTGEKSVRVRSGKVEVILTGADADQYEIRNNHVVLKRFGQEVVEIVRREATDGSSTTGMASTVEGSGWYGWPADSPPPAIAPFDAVQAKAHQEAWATYLKVPVEYTNSIGMKFRLIPPGEFLMGSTQDEIDDALKDANPGYVDWPDKIRSEGPQHTVILTQPFYLGVHEVTQADYEQVTGKNPSQFSKTGPQTNDIEKSDVAKVAGLDTSSHPVERVSWNDAAEFCSLLSQKETLKPYYFRADETVTTLDGIGYRLPSEAEWEYACRAGTTTRFWSGTTEAELSLAGWFLKNSGKRTHAVGELKPNPFGLFDMHGNVEEWVQDAWELTYFAQFQGKAAVNPTGPQTTTSNRVIRGGYLDSYWDGASMCRAAARTYWGPAGRNTVSGFRVSLSVDAVRQASKLEGSSLALRRNRDAAWWALTLGAEVKVEIDGVETTLKSIDQLPMKDFFVTYVYFYQTTLKPESLEKLVDLSRLRVLRLVACRDGDKLTDAIGRMTELNHLQLNNCQVTDVGLERLRELSKLEYLDLNWQPGITDRGLEVVQGMRQLASLSIMMASVTDKGLNTLRELPLHHLSLDFTKVSDSGMAIVADLRLLEVLGLQGTNIGDVGIAQLQNLGKLRDLALQRTSVTDKGLSQLSSLVTLQNLYVAETKVTADGVASLRMTLPNCKIDAEQPSMGRAGIPDVAFMEWMKQIASRSPDAQAKAVIEKLRELNPEFDGKYTHKAANGAVTELLLENENIVDVSPLRALPQLKVLGLAGSKDPHHIGRLSNLSPLAGLQLTSFNCSFTQVSDLSPLSGMKLTELNCSNTRIDDLSPLVGMPLTDLACGYTNIVDLSPLKGMPLTTLDIHATTGITELSALQGLPLTKLVLFHNTRVTDLSPLKGMKLTVLDCFTTGVTDLSPLKGMPLTFLQCANTKVKDLSPLEGMPLTSLYCFATQVEDLSPLSGMPLTHLFCERTRVSDDALQHLHELTKLETLNLTDTKISVAGIAELRRKLPDCTITAGQSPTDLPMPTVVANDLRADVWDLLDASQIPETERIPEQPKELVAVLGEHRQRHAWGGVAGIAIRPDGKQFVTVARDGIRFWDGASFQQTSHFRPKGYERSAPAYLPKRNQLVVGGEGNLGQIWNLDEDGINDDQPVSLPRGTSTLPHARFFAVSPDEKWLVRRLEHFQFHLSLMSLTDTEPLIVAEYPGCRFAAFSPDGRLVAILQESDKTIRVLELGEGAPVERHVLKTESDARDDRPSKGFQQLVFLADGRLATADNNGRIWFWSLKGDEPQILFSTMSAKGVEPFLNAAQQAPIVVTSESGGVSGVLRIDADQAVLKHHATWTEYGRPESNLMSFAVFPDGRTAISGHLNGAIRFWDITGDKAVEINSIALQPVASPFLDLVILPGAIATRDEQNSLRLWQPTPKGLVEHSATNTEEPQKYVPVAASRDGRSLVTIWGGPGSTVWEWTGEELSQQLNVGKAGSRSAAISSDSRRLAIGYTGTVELWDITARPPRLEKTLQATDPNGAAYQVAFAKEDTLLIAKMGQTLTVWNLNQEDARPEPLLADRNPFLFAVSRTRDLLAVDGPGTQLLSLDQIPPQPVLTLKSVPGQFGSLAFSPDGRQLAVTDDVSVDRSIIDVYDIETGVRKHRMTLPMPLRRLEFADDNRHLVTTNSNGTIYVLRLADAPKTETTSASTKMPQPWHGWPADAPKPAIAPFNPAEAQAHQEAWAKYLKVPVEYTNSSGLKFRLIPPGEFLMGSAEEEIQEALRHLPRDAGWDEATIRGEGPQCRVVLSKPFFMCTTEATQEWYQTLIGSNPSGFCAAGEYKEAVAGIDTSRHPIDSLSWDAAVDFCNASTRRDQLQPCYVRSGGFTTSLRGNGYRLPTEAEWEFACRAGTTTMWWSGSGEQDWLQAGWFGTNATGRTHAVGELKANPFGLFDMHGNVSEYCQNWFAMARGADQVSREPLVDPTGPDGPIANEGAVHVVRGGTCQSNPISGRSTSRRHSGWWKGVGVRPVLPVEGVQQLLRATE